MYESNYEWPVGDMPLDEFFAAYPRFALAFSGGCDSSYLLTAAHKAGCDVKAYLVKSAFQPDREVDDARRLVHAIGVAFEVITVDVFAHHDICANTFNRCYYCKRVIFSAIQTKMKEDGFCVLADGTNATDDPARRPGFRALAELKVRSPLRRAGMTKDDVRAASQALNLFTAHKPSFSCLATKIPEGHRITQAALDEVARRLDNVRRAT